MIGRPRYATRTGRLDDAERAEIARLADAGRNVREIARELHRHPATIYTACRAHGCAPAPGSSRPDARVTRPDRRQFDRAEDDAITALRARGLSLRAIGRLCQRSGNSVYGRLLGLAVAEEAASHG